MLDKFVVYNHVMPRWVGLLTCDRETLTKYTRKNAQVLTGLETSGYTSCRQVVFALLVPSCRNKFGTSC